MAPPSPPPPPPPESAVVTNGHIANGLTAGFFCIVVLLCFLYILRSRAIKKRIEARNGASFLRPGMVETNLSSTSVPPPFSRIGITPSIVMPKKSITRDPYSHGLSDKAVVLSRLQVEPSAASSTLSFQYPLANAAPHPRVMSILTAHSRHSRSSSGFSTYTPNSPSPALTRLSHLNSVFPSQPRPVHQLFEPALPDELSVARYGEGLTVLQSFDDGWCLVARDTSGSSRLSHLFSNSGDKSDVGLVPAWVFVEPLKGNSVTRPFRNSSINALCLVHKPVDARDAVISWSFFG